MEFSRVTAETVVTTLEDEESHKGLKGSRRKNAFSSFKGKYFEYLRHYLTHLLYFPFQNIQKCCAVQTHLSSLRACVRACALHSEGAG